MTSASTATDTRQLIIESAFDCFRRHGLDKTTVVDIARAADVSRSTVYEYFRDKAEIVEACAEGASQKFYREMATAMRKGETLEDQLVLAGVFVTRARRFIEPEDYFDEDEVSLLLTKNAALLLRECGEFLAPYLAAAKLTGEVRKDLDVVAAGEWYRAHAVLVVQHSLGDFGLGRRAGRRRFRASARGARIRSGPAGPRALTVPLASRRKIAYFACILCEFASARGERCVRARCYATRRARGSARGSARASGG